MSTKLANGPVDTAPCIAVAAVKNTIAEVESQPAYAKANVKIACPITPAVEKIKNKKVK